MTKRQKIEIPVTYKVIDDTHLFYSDHPLALGLCAGSMCYDRARSDVDRQLDILLKYHHGIEDAEVTIVLDGSDIDDEP